VVVESDRPREVARRLGEQPFVHSTAQVGNSLRVLVDRDLEDAAGQTRRAVAEAGLSLHGCERVRPNLEDVFVAATQERKAQREARE
jgi:ABC-2 type transport system ATP-binding protein